MANAEACRPASPTGRTRLLSPTRRAIRTGGHDRSGHERGRGRGESGAPDRSERSSPESLPPTGAREPGVEVERVLVVDDESAIRLLCRVNLQGAGMDVLEAPDGETALALARTERPDLILLDVMMPAIDGWEVAEKLGQDERAQDIPIVFLTALAEQSARARGHALGAVAYVLKPFDPVGLAPFVSEILARLRRGEREELRREMLAGSGGNAPD